MNFPCRTWILAIVAIGVAAPTNAALTISVSYDSSVTSLAAYSQIQTAINYVASEYENRFADPITVHITVQATSTSGVLGESLTSLLDITGQNSYSSVRTALTNDKTTASDTTAVNSLGATDPTSGATFWYTRAQAQALGVDPNGANDSNSAGTFIFGTAQTYTYSSFAATEGWGMIAFSPRSRERHDEQCLPQKACRQDLRGVELFSSRVQSSAGICRSPGWGTCSVG